MVKIISLAIPIWSMVLVTGIMQNVTQSITQNDVTPAYSGLNRAECVSDYVDSLSTHIEEKVSISSGSIQLAGTLFRPDTEKPVPAIVFMHGGGNNLQNLRSAPLYLGAVLANCGYAALYYDKRGTGDSGGEYAVSTFDDFVQDASQGIDFLANHPAVDPADIGILGFSQGGRLAPVVAVRNPRTSFAVSVSGPITSVSNTRLYALENSFRNGGMSQERLDLILPLWESHFRALRAKDDEALSALDSEIDVMAGQVHPATLPPRSNAIPQTGIYNSIGRDYATELSKLSVPWFSLYGEVDQIVPVQASITILQERMRAGNHDGYEIKVIPSVGHSFQNPETREFTSFDQIVVDWILARKSN